MESSSPQPRAPWLTDPTRHHCWSFSLLGDGERERLWLRLRWRSGLGSLLGGLRLRLRRSSRLRDLLRDADRERLRESERERLDKQQCHKMHLDKSIKTSCYGYIMKKTPKFIFHWKQKQSAKATPVTICLKAHRNTDDFVWKSLCRWSLRTSFRLYLQRKNNESSPLHANHDISLKTLSNGDTSGIKYLGSYTVSAG